MNRIADFLKNLVCGMTAVLVFMAGIAVIPAFAEAGSVSIATLTPHYKNPATGEIEDSGGESSAVLGQSMTESATHTQALVEKTDSGQLYVTVRLKLMDNIEDPKFQVSDSSGKKFRSVSAATMQENYTDNTADFRMEVHSEQDIIRCAMRVVPMGRDVVFYMTLSDLQAGSGDFIVSVKQVQQTESTKKPAGTTKKKTETGSKTTTNQTTAEQQTTTRQNQNSTTKQTSAAGAITTEKTTTSVQSTTAATTPTPANGTTVQGIAEFDAGGDAVTEQSAGESKENADSSKTGVIVLICVGAAAVAVTIVWVVHRRRRG